MKTLNDLKDYILTNYGVSPDSFDGEKLTYHSVVFEKRKPDVRTKTEGLWVVHRKGHSIDFFRSEEFNSAVDVGGSLLYWFMPGTK